MINASSFSIPLSPTAVPAFYIMRTGEIVSLDGYMIDVDGTITRKVGDEYWEVPQNPDHADYMLANVRNSRLSTDTGFRSLYIQRVIMSSFHGEDWFPTAVADHIDNNKQNNNLSNLQWLTMTDNTRKARNIPVIATDINTGAETLCENILECIKFTGISGSTINKMLKGGVCRSSVKFTVRLAN